MARALVTALGLSLGLVASAAAEATDRPAAEARVWTTVGDATLEAMRGGFDLGGGLMVSFSISRVIVVNGVLMTSTAFQVPDLGRITPAQAAAFERQFREASLVQIGAGNTAPSNGSMSAAAVVQNTLDNQSIQTRTVIDTTTNGMSMAKGLNAGAALQDALMRAASSR